MRLGGWLLSLGLAGVALFGPGAVRAVAEPPDLPPPTLPTEFAVTTLPHPPLPPPPPPLVPQPPAPLAPDAPPPFLAEEVPPLGLDPMLDPAFLPQPGWFGSLEFGLLFPRLHGHLTPQPAFPAIAPGRFPQVNAAGIDVAGSYRAVLGYRLSEGFGEFLLAYRGISGEQKAIFVNGDPFGAAFFRLMDQGEPPPVRLAPFAPGGASLVRSRFDVNLIDLGYANHEFALGPLWDMRWEAGARLGNFFNDDSGQSWWLSQEASNRFIGAGPYVNLGLSRRLNPEPGVGGLSAFGKVEGATLLGRDTQHFNETALLLGGVRSRSATQSMVQAVESVGVQAGLSWVPAARPNQRLVVGYQFDQWWNIGTVGASRVDLRLQGIFFRWQWNY